MKRIKELEDSSQKAADQKAMEWTGYGYYEKSYQEGWWIRGVSGGRQQCEELMNSLGKNQQNPGKTTHTQLYWFFTTLTSH